MRYQAALLPEGPSGLWGPGDGVKVVLDVVGASGAAFRVQFVAQFQDLVA